jgi:hypothetical protein
MIVVTTAMTILFILFFSIRNVAGQRYTVVSKKELGQAIYFLLYSLPPIKTYHLLLYIIVDFLNSIFSFFTEPGIFPDT